MKKKIIIIIAVILVIVAGIVLAVSLSGGGKPDKDNITVTLTVDDYSYYDYDNIITCKMVVENNNDYAVNMFGGTYSDDDLTFNTTSQGAAVVSAKGKYENRITIEFNNEVEFDDYIELLKKKKISFTFAKITNDKGTKVKPVIVEPTPQVTETPQD